MDSRGIRCVFGWKENWDNIYSFKVDKKCLIFKTKNGKMHKIANIDEEDFPIMTNFINRRLKDDRIKENNIE